MQLHLRLEVLSLPILINSKTDFRVRANLNSLTIGTNEMLTLRQHSGAASRINHRSVFVFSKRMVLSNIITGIIETIISNADWFFPEGKIILFVWF